MEDEDEMPHRRKKVVIRQKRSHANARNGQTLSKAEALAVLLILERERREGRGGGCGGPNSSAVGTEMNKIFSENKYCDKNYVDCFRHLDQNSVEDSDASFRNIAVQYGGFDIAFFTIPTFFNNFEDFKRTWDDLPQRVKSLITETFGFTVHSIDPSLFNALRFEKIKKLREAFNDACIRAEGVVRQIDDIVQPEILSPRSRNDRRASEVLTF